MPLIGFVCKKGKVNFKECFEGCQEQDRCRPMAFLKRCEIHRKLLGYSTTELISPTCQLYLKKTILYHQSPDDLEYMLEGSLMHYALEKPIIDALQEERIKDEISSGKFDIYRNEVLEDYKRAGMYKIKLILEKGIVVAGQDYIYQLNDYRTKLEGLGFKVREMAIWLCGRDYGWLDKKQGLKKWNRVVVPKTNINRLKAYFGAKKRALEAFEKAGRPLYPCKPGERWGGKRCWDWCPEEVRTACPLPEDMKIKPEKPAPGTIIWKEKGHEKKR